MAIQKNNMAMVKLLLHLGAGLHSLNSNGSSPYNLLEERQIEYVAQTSQKEPSSKLHDYKQINKHHDNKEVIEVHVEDVKEELVDDMFSKMRNYFDHKGYIGK